MHRLEKLQAHLLRDGKEEEDANDAPEYALVRNETRSVSDWASDLYAMAFKDLKMTERHGGDLVAETLKAHGVKWIFCLSGGHISPILVSSENLGIRIVDVRHEVNTVFAADAVGRLTGIPGVAAVTAGPGVTNTVTAIKNCRMAQSPMVLLGGAAATVMQGRGALQDIDHMAIISPIVKWSYSCRTARDIVPALRRAFQEATSGVPGPVFLEMPLDVLYPVAETFPQGGTHARLRAGDLQGDNASPELLKRLHLPVEATEKGMTAKEYVESKPPAKPVFVELPDEEKASFAMRMGFNLLIRRIHSGAHEPQDFSPLPKKIPMPKPADISKTATLLAKATKPLILVGSQATVLGPDGTQQLADTINKLQVPCFLGGMSRGLLGRNNPLHIRQNRGGALKKCDLVIMLGVVPDFRLDYGRGLPKSASIITVNRSAAEATMNTDLFWKPTLVSESDPCLFLVELGKYANSNPAWAPWAADLKSGEVAKEKKNSEKAKEKAIGRGRKEGMQLINPLYLCEQLEDLLPEDSILVADGGDFVATASYILRPRGPLRWLDPGAFGTLGVGGGFALGAKLVNPSAQVWIIWGDGSCGYSLLEFDTFTRHNIPVIGLVGNDACWTQIEREQVPMFQSAAACELDYLEYHKSAQGLGAEGIELKSADDDIRGGLQEAQRLVDSGKPVLMNVHIGKTDFREGSISV